MIHRYLLFAIRSDITFLRDIEEEHRERKRLAELKKKYEETD